MRTLCSALAVPFLLSSAVLSSALLSAPAAAERPATLPLCTAAKEVSERTKRRFVVVDETSCAAPVRLPQAGLSAEESARRFVLGLVGAGHAVVEAQGETRVLGTKKPGWLQRALEQCKDEGERRGPLVHLRAAVGPDGAVLWVKLEATGHEDTARGRCLIDAARGAKLAPVGGATTTYAFPLGAPMRTGVLPAELKEKLKEGQKIPHGPAPTQQSGGGGHDGHAH